MTAHTVDEALKRFKLLKGSTGDLEENTACAMTGLVVPTESEVPA